VTVQLPASGGCTRVVVPYRRHEIGRVKSIDCPRRTGSCRSKTSNGQTRSVRVSAAGTQPLAVRRKFIELSPGQGDHKIGRCVTASHRWAQGADSCRHRKPLDATNRACAGDPQDTSEHRSRRSGHSSRRGSDRTVKHRQTDRHHWRSRPVRPSIRYAVDRPVPTR